MNGRMLAATQIVSMFAGDDSPVDFAMTYCVVCQAVIRNVPGSVLAATRKFKARRRTSHLCNVSRPLAVERLVNLRLAQTVAGAGMHRGTVGRGGFSRAEPGSVASGSPVLPSCVAVLDGEIIILKFTFIYIPYLYVLIR
jgi:hypothetical protein